MSSPASMDRAPLLLTDPISEETLDDIEAAILAASTLPAQALHNTRLRFIDEQGNAVPLTENFQRAMELLLRNGGSLLNEVRVGRQQRGPLTDEDLERLRTSLASLRGTHYALSCWRVGEGGAKTAAPEMFEAWKACMETVPRLLGEVMRYRQLQPRAQEEYDDFGNLR